MKSGLHRFFRNSLALPSLAVASLLALGAQAAAPAPGPPVGKAFPHKLEAPDQHGKPRSLETLMGARGVALLFVRSADWCPFCKGQLVEVNRKFPQFKELGLNVVSISVDAVAPIAEFAREQKILYTMLADPTGAINLALGIRDEQYPVGSKAFGVPRPTLYVVDRKGIIRLRYIEPTFRTRPDLTKVIADVRALQLPAAK